MVKVEHASCYLMQYYWNEPSMLLYLGCTASSTEISNYASACCNRVLMSIFIQTLSIQSRFNPHSKWACSLARPCLQTVEHTISKQQQWTLQDYLKNVYFFYSIQACMYIYFFVLALIQFVIVFIITVLGQELFVRIMMKTLGIRFTGWMKDKGNIFMGIIYSSLLLGHSKGCE